MGSQATRAFFLLPPALPFAIDAYRDLGRCPLFVVVVHVSVSSYEYYLPMTGLPVSARLMQQALGSGDWEAETTLTRLVRPLPEMETETPGRR